MKSLIVSLLVVVGLGTCAVPSYALTWDAYVSSTGTDTGSCFRPTPCATFSYALTQVSGGGVIHVVDSGAYGAATIAHSVTIDGGGLATTLAGGGFSITLAAQLAVSAAATDVVTIQNFTMSGVGAAPSAVAVASVGALHVQNCNFVRYSGAAIDFRATGGLLDMKDVTITDIQGGNGIYVGNGRAMLDHVSISRTQTAVLSAGAATVFITHSTANGNGSGFVAAYGPTAELHIDDCTMTNNQWAVVAGQGATAYVSRSSLTNNFIVALFNDGASHLISYGDNRFASNASDGAFTGMAAVK